MLKEKVKEKEGESGKRQRNRESVNRESVDRESVDRERVKRNAKGAGWSLCPCWRVDKGRQGRSLWSVCVR